MTHQQAIDGLASERYLLDEMSEMERYEFEAHYFDCPECADEVRLGESIREESRRLGPATVVGSQSPSGAKVLTHARWRRPMRAVPWAAAAALAALASYQSLVTVPTLKHAVAPEAISPVTLRGATRGASTVVKISPSQRFVALATDVMAEAGVRSLTYELLDSTHTRVASGQASVPAAGAPLMLVVPVDELRTAGKYTLIVRNTEHAAVISENEFDVSY
jgi:hypothetical protein